MDVPDDEAPWQQRSSDGRPPTMVDVRRGHARGFLQLVRPGVLMLAIVLAAASEFGAGHPFTRPTLDATLAYAALVVAGMVAARYVDPLRLAVPMIIVDTVAVLGVVWVSPDPRGASINLLVPLVAMTYFGDARKTLLLTVALVPVTLGMAGAEHTWNEPTTIPAISFVIAVVGSMLAFLSSRTRTVQDETDRYLERQRELLDSMRRFEVMREGLVANVSHELRTPITVAKGFLQTAMDPGLALDATQRTAMLEQALAGTDRLQKLVAELVEFSTTSVESVVASARELPLGPVVVAAVEHVSAPADRTLLVVVETDPIVRIDRARIMRVVVSLLVNAIQHGAGDVRVTVRGDESSAYVDVVDEGAGVPPDRVGELFQPFARFSDRTDSTGLGLAISRSIVVAHQGSLQYERIHGQTRFRVVLPRVVDRPEHADAERLPAEPAVLRR